MHLAYTVIKHGNQARGIVCKQEGTIIPSRTTCIGMVTRLTNHNTFNANLELSQKLILYNK